MESEEAKMSGEAFAFRTFSELSSHLRQYHGIAQNTKMAQQYAYPAGSSRHGSFVDLDMGTANPYGKRCIVES
jgi:hypothetical protein